MLRKVVRCRNFLRIWFLCTLKSRRSRYIKQDGSLRTQILVDQKRNSWLRTHGPLPSRSHLLAFLGLFLFFFSYVPFLWQQTTFLGCFLFFFSRPLLVETDHLPWSSSFLSHVPLIFGDRPALAELNGFHVRDLVCSSLEKKSFAFLT